MLAGVGEMGKEALDAALAKFGVVAPDTKNPISPCFPFNLMFKTSIGPKGDLTGYLRPETAQVGVLRCCVGLCRVEGASFEAVCACICVYFGLFFGAIWRLDTASAPDKHWTQRRLDWPICALKLHRLVLACGVCFGGLLLAVCAYICVFLGFCWRDVASSRHSISPLTNKHCTKGALDWVSEA